MSDHERTEEPTPRKLRRARERGEVAQAPLAGAALSLAGVTFAFAAGGEAMLASWRRLVELTWSGSAPPEVALARAAEVAATALFWPLAAAVALGALASFLQVGPLFTATPIAPDLARLDVGRGLSRLASPAELAPRAGALALAVLLLSIAAAVLHAALPGLLGRTDASFALDAGASVIGAVLARAIALFALAAAIGIAYRRWRFARDQRMSRRELRQEQRETEGEPLARRRRAELHRERALGPSVEQALDGAILVVRGSGLSAVVRWSPSTAEPPAVSLVARGPLSSRVAAGAIRAGVASVFDEALAIELARGRELPRALLRRLARHLARRETDG